MLYPVVSLSNLSLSFGDAQVLQNWSQSIGSGLTLIRGQESTGKTSVLRLLAKTLRPDAGEIRFTDPAATETFWADPASTSHDQVSAEQFFASLAALYKRFDLALAQELAQGLGLAEHLHKPLYMLSTGSRRKVWIAAAFASGAALTLIDTPFAALDKGSRDLVRELLQDAALHTSRAIVIADYEAPAGISPLAIIDLPQAAA